jgi:hypothetical protein
LSPRKGDLPPRSDPAQKLLDDLDKVVRRMIAAAPVERHAAIRERWRLKRAFLGRAAPSEQTKDGRAAIQLGVVNDDLMIGDIADNLLDGDRLNNKYGGDLLAEGLPGAIHDVLMEQWSKTGEVRFGPWKMYRAERPPWANPSRTRRARVKTIRDKLRRHLQRVEEEFRQYEEDEPVGDPKAEK